MIGREGDREVVVPLPSPLGRRFDLPGGESTSAELRRVTAELNSALSALRRAEKERDAAVSALRIADVTNGGQRAQLEQATAALEEANGRIVRLTGELAARMRPTAPRLPADQAEVMQWFASRDLSPAAPPGLVFAYLRKDFNQGET